MNKKALMWTIAAVGVGFLVGFGVGQKTREATPSRVDVDVSGGVATIRADLAGAVGDGVNGYIEQVFGGL